MESCPGCQREFKSLKSLNSHKRFCQAWQDLGQSRAKRTIPLKERKQKTADCPNCGKTFKNVYSMSSHKGHCIGLNDYESRSQEAKDRMAWSRGESVLTKDDLSMKHPVSEVFSKSNKTAPRLRKWVFNIFNCECCMEWGVKEWNGKKLNLEVHHVNGIRDNNKLSNLQVLCPNCHSQTWNYRRRKSKFVPPSKTLKDHVSKWYSEMNDEIESEHFKESLEEIMGS